MIAGKVLLPVLIFALAFPALTTSQNGPSGDFQSPEGVLKALYESLTFADGGAPDLVRFKNLFASAAAPCVRTTPGAVLVTDLQGFLESFEGRVVSGAIKSFREWEISRRTETYGNIAQVFSVYRKTVNSADPEKSVRGVNSFQLCRLEGSWRIVSLTWEDETPENPVPAKYLK